MKAEIIKGHVMINLTEKCLQSTYISCDEFQIREKKDIDYNRLDEIVKSASIGIQPTSGKMLPAVCHEFNKRELEQYRKDIKEY